jgi:signal transduction histidine kinase
VDWKTADPLATTKVKLNTGNFTSFTNTGNFALSPGENNIVIEIRDNGVGFEIDEVYKGLGLKNMEQRAQASGMTVDLQSRPGKGTWLTITSPINK